MFGIEISEKEKREAWQLFTEFRKQTPEQLLENLRKQEDWEKLADIQKRKAWQQLSDLKPELPPFSSAEKKMSAIGGSNSGKNARFGARL